MRTPLPLLLALLLAAVAMPPGTAASVKAQGALAWERVGDHSVSASDLVFAPDGALWSVGDRFWRLDTSGGGAGVWENVYDLPGERLLFLSPDTLLKTPGISRSLDGGESWELLYGDGRDFLYEVPHGRPHGGTVMTGTNGGLARSTDRGATWTQATFETGTTANTQQSVVALANGRVVAAGRWGVLYSDDGGATFHPGSVWEYLRQHGYAIGVVEAPGGGERVLAVVADGTRPHLVVHGSADGATWTELAELVDVDDGGVGQGGIAGPRVLGLGGPSAVVVLGRGSVYRTDDSGDTWVLIGRAPTDTTSVYPVPSAVGPDGRLYVGMRGPAAFRWVWRTVAPIPVAAEGGPEALDGLTLRVEPNPSSGALSLVLTLPVAASARLVLYDTLGREVAFVHEGPLAAGTHRLALDAGGLTPGAYVARAVVGGRAVAARLVLTR